ncbi:hypothetical protein Sru01_31650 [Sphaerisporangium rufum]|uniref:Uncharacterized protein n=1 Tax=Sphaerisporangium rufum TaxID=1381558 RepID=A0A919R2L8_9ACTN|nr:hypothetical protein [Sphaerisporangium rufum]GII78183.1 hypothetical protein Sru01_31650 [Sphaerisporangium rufum]
MSRDPTGAARPTLTFDPDDLTAPQRAGDACAVCHKKWPRPRVRVGRLPNSAPVMACEDCAETLLPPPPASRRRSPRSRASLR